MQKISQNGVEIEYGSQKCFAKPSMNGPFYKNIGPSGFLLNETHFKRDNFKEMLILLPQSWDVVWHCKDLLFCNKHFLFRSWDVVFVVSIKFANR